MVALFREVRRVLRDDGVLWLNLGDSYTSDFKTGGRNDTEKMYSEHSQHLSKRKPTRVSHGLKPKELVGIPWRVAFALQADGWYLRNDIIWSKPNPMPESVTDRATRSHEYIFMLTKQARYFYDAKAVREYASTGTMRRAPTRGESYGAARGANGRAPDRDGGFGSVDGARNLRSVWKIAGAACHAAHFAVFPWELPRRCIVASTKPDDIVFDPFTGSGTTAAVALANGRRYIGTELNPEYVKIANARIEATIDALGSSASTA